MSSQVLVSLSAFALLVGLTTASVEDGASQRPPYYKKWRKNAKMVVFGDSGSDSGRRYNAPGSFDYDDIGPFPWRKLYEANDTETKVNAYLPGLGTPTNGKVWPDWLLVPEELNFATSSASMTDVFRSRENCLGYTGAGEDYPTGTLDEQIERYLYEIGDSEDTLDYTHVIILGGNDFTNLLGAVERYSLVPELQDEYGLFVDEDYEDPVSEEIIFDDDGQVDFETFGTLVVTALADGITKLLAAGVTGKILVANTPSFRIITDIVDTGAADTLDLVSLSIGSAIQEIVDLSPQLRLLDMYTLFASIVDDPEEFLSLGFCPPDDADSSDPLSLASPCLQPQFSVDGTAEIMGTQAFRAEGCQDECTLCGASESPCQTCLSGNPYTLVCDDPDSRLFWDIRHPTTATAQLLADAIRECAKDYPDYDRPFVEKLCPGFSTE